MADRTVTVRLNAITAPYIAGMQGAQKATVDFAERTSAAGLKNSASLEKVGKASLVVGGVLSAAFIAAVAASAQFDKAMSAVRANIDDKSAPSMKRLSDAALQAGQTTVYSATQAAEAENELAKAGLSSADIVGGGLRAALTLASAGQIDLSSAAEITSATMVQFGLHAKDAAHIADDLAAGADKSLGGVTDLGEALKYAGVNASQMGISLDQTVGTLAEFASVGITGSMAGTGLRQILISLAAPTQQASDTMKQYGINVFDTSGKFIGMSGLSEQLRTKLGGLTQQQQQQALSNIFTARSMAEVNVLMREGAAGSDRWTAAVNDQGFAAQQAATKLDNLSGDAKKLANSLNVALIKGGSGANSGLRDITQAATGAVNAFSKLPAPIQQGTVLLSGVAGAGLLVVGMMGTLIPRVQAGRAALAELGPAGAAANKGLGMAAAGAGKFAVGAAAVTVAATAVSGLMDLVEEHSRKAVPGVNSLETALVQLGATGKATGALTGNSATNLNTFGQALQRLTNPSASAQINDWGDKVTHAIIGNAGFSSAGLHQAQATTTGIDNALTALVQGGSVTDAQNAFSQLSALAASYGVSQARLTQLLPNYANALAGVSVANGGTAASTDKFGASVKAVSGDLQAASGAASDLKTMLDELNGVNIDAASAQIKVVDSQVALTAALRASGGAIGEINAKGQIMNAQARESYGDFVNAAQAINDHAQAVYNQTGSLEAANAAMATDKARLVAMMEAAHVSQATIDLLTGSMLRVPTTVTTKVTTPGAVTSTGQVNDLQGAIKGVPPSRITKFNAVNTNATIAAADRVRGAVMSVPLSRTITFLIKSVTSGGSGPPTDPTLGGILPKGGGAAGGRVVLPGYAGGSWGAVHGAGTKTSDSNLVAVSDGEYVSQAKSVDLYGPDFYDALNAGLVTVVRGAQGWSGGSSTQPSAPTRHVEQHFNFGRTEMTPAEFRRAQYEADLRDRVGMRR